MEAGGTEFDAHHVHIVNAVVGQAEELGEGHFVTRIRAGAWTGGRFGELALEHPVGAAFEGVDVALLADGDGLAGLGDDEFSLLTEVVGADDECARIHAEEDSEVEAVAGGEVLMGIFLHGIGARQVVRAEGTDELDLSCDSAVSVLEHESM